MTYLTLAQRRAIDRDDLGWRGWDARGLPVIHDDIDPSYHYALDKNGEAVPATEPIQQP